VKTLVAVLALALLVLLAVAVVSAIFLALGTGLTHLFAVSVWEATIVVMVAAGTVLWLLATFLPPAPVPPLEETEDEPSVYVTSLPPAPWKGAKKRRRLCSLRLVSASIATPASLDPPFDVARPGSGPRGADSGVVGRQPPQPEEPELLLPAHLARRAVA
jgi:hypothetical protein